jgi:predicted RND superfamily exporter protein
MIGIVVLSGILVNDGIIMVDFINQQRRIYGLPLGEAIVEGASARLRPILMTTATTVLGLLPLALGFGEGSQLQAPMAITIIGGQITGTILLLLAIPSIYKVVTKDTLQPDAAAAVVSTAPFDGSANRLAVPAGGAKRKNNRSDKPVHKLILRLVVILILAALIIYLAVFSGQDISMVIQ